MQANGDSTQLSAAITVLETQRALLGDAVVDAALAAMRAQLNARSPAAAAEQQRKQATVLFADVVGFTTLSETKDAEEVTELINALWSRLDGLITAYGGRIDKHIGDAVMALWGVESAREDDPERAIRAALAMQDEVNAFNGTMKDRRRLPDHISLELRVGINTGPVLLGQVGLTREFTAMGDTVNLANRLEQAAPLGGVLVAHNTYRHVRGVFDARALGPIQVRGRHEAVPAYVVLRPKPRAFRLNSRGVEGVETRMIGRDAELAALQAAFGEAVAGARPRVLTIIGEAGVGKSRLLYEFDTWVDLRPERVRYFKGRATPALQGVPFSLWRDVFAFRFDILDSDSPAVALSKFRHGFVTTRRAGVDAAGMEVIANQADIVGHWLGFDFSASPAVARLAGSPDFVPLAQAHFVRFMRALAAERGIALLLEDIHWADDSSLDLIGRLARAAVEDGAPAHLLILCLARPSLYERHPGWGHDLPGFQTIELNPLDTASSLALVDEILQRADDVPDALRRLIVEGAEGNPFYIEELVKMLIEQGVIERVAGGEERGSGGAGEQGSEEESSLVTRHSSLPEVWRIRPDRLQGVQVPATLTGLLQARLDGLPRAEREVLQRAAVVGRVFWDDAVGTLADGAELPDSGDAAHTLESLLDSLARRELIVRRERSVFAGTTEYTFKHNLLREVTYQTVLLRARRRHHARVARWLELNAGGRLGEYLGLIAEHYALAGAGARAAAYLERAGDSAQRSGAYPSARAAVERALALLQAEETAADAAISALRLKLGAITWNLGDFPAAERALFYARDYARRAGDGRGQALALYWLSRVSISRGDYAQARMLLAYSLPLARAADAETLAQVLYGVADVAWRVGDLETLNSYISESLSLARALDNSALELMSLNRLGTMAYLKGDLATARAYYRTCLDLAQSTGNMEREATALMNLGALAHRGGDTEAGAAYYRDALAHYRELGRSEQVVMALGNLAEAGIDQGDLARARADLREGLVLAWRLGLLPRAMVLLFVYGRLLAAEGQPEAAAATLRLVLHHPATESQTRPQATALLQHLGCPADGPAAELERLVDELLA
jgi:predicted ATPase/class 3 adenylate cyclase